MRPRWQIRIYEKRRLLHSAEFAGPLELGRQNDADDKLFDLKQIAGRGRLAIARLDEQGMSRKQLLLTPLPSGQVRVENLSAALSVFLSAGTELTPGSKCDAPLPLVLNLDPKVIRVEQAEEGGSNLLMRSLREAPRPPQATIMASHFPALKMEAREQVNSQEMVAWLQAAMGVFLSAATSADFFTKAAQAVVEVVGLDSGRVMILDGETWRSEALHTSPRVAAETNWQASRSVLGRVVEEKRTFWEVPPAAASLKDIKAVVAAPILDAQGVVAGVLYGDCRLGSAGLGADLITEMQARLVELLASGVAAGLARLKHEQAALVSRIQFEQFFTPELAHELAADPTLLEGRDCEVTLLFCDVRGFSGISERLGPARTVAWIADVMETLSQCVQAQHGVLVDYIGDELIAMWGAPGKEPDHARLACRAALAMLDALPELNQRWEAILGQPMNVGIGINTGVARVGNMGSRRKLKYGPLGNTVNLASRVQGATKYLKCRLLITGATRGQLDDSFAPRRLCTVRVVNINEPVQLYELATASQPGWPQAREEYEAALEAFETRNFHAAARILGNWSQTHPDDGPALVLLGRVVHCMIEEQSGFDPVLGAAR